MLRQSGLRLILLVLLSNATLAIVMQISAKLREYPSAERFDVESIENAEVKAHWVAGNTLCNPRVALCH